MPISRPKQQELEERLQVLGIRREEVLEQFVRASGPGGQKVNKTSSAVYLKHLPSGIEVKAQKDRSQLINRFLAWRLLADKVEARKTGKDPRAAERDRLRKQKQRRRRKTRGREREEGSKK
jgi:protein subunit release factor B